MEFVIIIISAIFVNNIVLAQFLGICPFIGVSSKVETSVGMTGAVTFILVIASLVQLVEIMLKKISPALYQALGIFLPLITTNCAVLGVAILAQQNDYDLLQSVVFAIANAVGFGLALITFAGIREHLDLVDVPKPFKGVPISFVVAGLLALAFM